MTSRRLMGPTTVKTIALGKRRSAFQRMLLGAPNVSAGSLFELVCGFCLPFDFRFDLKQRCRRQLERRSALWIEAKPIAERCHDHRLFARDAKPGALSRGACLWQIGPVRHSNVAVNPQPVNENAVPPRCFLTVQRGARSLPALEADVMSTLFIILVVPSVAIFIAHLIDAIRT
jgi:hypothetical protein